MIPPATGTSFLAPRAGATLVGLTFVTISSPHGVAQTRRSATACQR